MINEGSRKDKIMNNKYNNEFKEKIVLAYLDGKSEHYISRNFDIPRTSVQSILKQANVPKRQVSLKYVNNPWKPVDDAVEKAKLQLKTYENAYKEGLITQEELLKAEEQIGKEYSRWAETKDRMANASINRKVMPTNPKESVFDDDVKTKVQQGPTDAVRGYKTSYGANPYWDLSIRPKSDKRYTPDEFSSLWLGGYFG